MIKKISTLLILFVLFSNEIMAKPIEKTILGNIEDSDKTLVFRGTVYPLYQFLDTCYVPITYLENMGAECTVQDDALIIHDLNEKREPKAKSIDFKNPQVTLNASSVYIDDLKTYSIVVEEQVLIPIKALARLWEITEQGNFYRVLEKNYKVEEYIQINDQYLINTSPYTLRVGVISLGWNGESYVENKKDDILLEPYQQIEKLSFISEMPKETYYLTTVVTQINGLSTTWDKKEWYGQKNTLLFKTYDYTTKVETLTALFPAYHVKARLKYAIGQLKEGENVYLWRTEGRRYHVIIGPNDRKQNLPWGSLDIESDRGLYPKPAADEQIEDYVTIKNIASKTNYILWTDLYRQKTYVLKYINYRWHLEKSIVCSSGKNSSPTPHGFFKLEYAMPYIGMQKGYRCKNAVVFFRDYMYHSIIFDKEGKYVINGKYQLGRRVSHGCIRVSEEDSAWIYKYVPIGTTVWIQ